MPIIQDGAWGNISKVLAPKVTLTTLLEAKQEMDRIIVKPTIKKRTIEALRARKPKAGEFASWMFPIIQNMAEVDIIDQLVAIQPMQLPAGELLYMDMWYGPRRQNRRPSRERNLERLIIEVQELTQERDYLLTVLGPGGDALRVEHLTARIREIESRIERERRVVMV